MRQIRSTNRDYLKSQSLTRKRRKKKLIRFWIKALIFIFLIAGIVWIVSLPSLAIKKVVVVGNNNITSGEISTITNQILDTRYMGLFTKRNALIYPKKHISNILSETYPRIESIGVETESLEILNIKITERKPSAIWCAAIACYLVDETGFIFAPQLAVNTAMGVSVNTVVNTTGDTSVGAPVSTVSVSPDTTNDQAKYINSLNQMQQDVTNLVTLHGEDELIGPEPIGKYIFTRKMFDDISNTVSHLTEFGLVTKDVHVFGKDEIVFIVAGGGKIIFSDRLPWNVSIENLKSSLKSSVFTEQGGKSTTKNHSISSTSSSSPMSVPTNFEYIDVRFGNKVFYKFNKGTESSSGVGIKNSSTTKNDI
jgi:hypothetical protein